MFEAHSLMSYTSLLSTESKKYIKRQEITVKNQRNDTEFRYDIEVGIIRECKVIVINMLKALIKVTIMKDQRDTFSTVITIGKNQMEILEVKT